MPPVTAQDLLTPTGDIDSKLLFPGVVPAQVNAKLDSWLATAYAALPDATVDNEDKVNEGAREFAYFKAFNEAYERMALSPLRTQVANEASDAYDMAQIREIASIAATHQDRYNDVLASFELIFAPPPARVSNAVKTKITW